MEKLDKGGKCFERFVNDLEQQKGLEPKIIAFQGKEGVKRAYLDEIEEGKTVYLLCGKIKKSEDVLKWFLEQFSKKRVKKGVKLKMLVSSKDKAIAEKYKLVEVHELFHEFPYPVTFAAYGNKFKIILWENELCGIIIEDKHIANFFKRIFKVLWCSCALHSLKTCIIKNLHGRKD